MIDNTASEMTVPPAPVMHEKLCQVLALIEKYPVTKVSYLGRVDKGETTIRSQDRDMGESKGKINEWIREETGERESIKVLDKNNYILQSWDCRSEGGTSYIWKYTETPRKSHKWPYYVKPLCETYRLDGARHYVFVGCDEGDTERTWEFRKDGETLKTYIMESVVGGYQKNHYDRDGTVSFLLQDP